MDLRDIRQTISVESGNVATCEDCGKLPVADWTADIHVLINHYLEHGYELIHVGSQTSRDAEGAPSHKTVAVLGRTSDSPAAGS